MNRKADILNMKTMRILVVAAALCAAGAETGLKALKAKG